MQRNGGVSGTFSVAVCVFIGQVTIADAMRGMVGVLGGACTAGDCPSLEKFAKQVYSMLETGRRSMISSTVPVTC